MNRNKFLSVLGVSAGTVIFAPFLQSCTYANSGLAPVSAGSIDFTLDLTLPAFAALNADGGSLVKNGVIVVRTAPDVYVALSSACTHEGATIGFNVAANRFICPLHGANFSTAGSVLMGPALRPLIKYNTTLSGGTSLRVYA
ncbi:MAG TPA: Rieske (2Fe-2S) protein [Prolixibacteraceae bacterium]|jgi:cytochrome b6-f complex iron-sulfur subunit